MFTVEQYSYEASNVPVIEANKILKGYRKRKNFQFVSLVALPHGMETDPFYVGKASLTIGEISQDLKFVSKISFNMQGVNPLD